MLPRVSRFSYALWGAIAVHAALFLLRPHGAPRRVGNLPQPPLQVLVVEVPAVEAAPPSARAEDAPGSAAAHAASTPPAVAPALHQVEVVGAEAAPGGVAQSGDGTAAVPTAAGLAQADAAVPARKLDLHLSDGFFMRPPSDEGPRAHKPEVQRQLEASLSADDVKHGLARGNAFVGALHDAAREGGPTRGEALLSVTVGADGSLTSVEFLGGSSAEWAAALEAFRSLAARKRLRVPPGARGLRVTYSVQAKVQLPSGKSVGGPIDVRPSGLALQGTFDVADVGSSAQRLVYARVVSEEVL